MILKTFHYIKGLIRNNNWQELYEMVDIKTEFNLFSNYMTISFQKCFTQEIIKINYKNQNPWINQALKYEIKQRGK